MKTALEYEDHIYGFAENMRDRWEKRAQLNYRYFTESVNFADNLAWDTQADREVKLYLHELDPRWLAGGSCLEIGCGPGRILQRLGPHFSTVVGVDISPTMLRHARVECSSLPNVHFVQTGGLDLGCLASRRFQLVVMQAVAIHLPLPIIQYYINESSRVLSEDGHLRFTAYRNPTAEDVTENQPLIDSAGAKIPPDAGDLMFGPDYIGHIFEDGELEAMLDRGPFSRRRIERLSPFTFGVDVWR